MIGLVIVSHCNIGKSIIEAANLITQKQNLIFDYSVSNIAVPIEELRQDIINIIEKADQGTGVIVLTDLFGGTPSNLSISILGVKKIEIVAGVNLPMVLKLLSLREEEPKLTIKEASIAAQEAGQKQISVASKFMS